MFAIIIANTKHKNTRKIVQQQVGKANIIEVGRRSSVRRLKRLLNKYNGEVILSADCKRLNIKTFDTEIFKAELLYLQFAKKMLALNGRELRIGLFDRQFKILDRELTTLLIAHASATLICTQNNISSECRDWLIKTGICPDVTDSLSDLSICDYVFSPFEGCPHSPTVFGKNGIGLNLDYAESLLPAKYLFLIDKNVNPAELLCMLCHEGEAHFPKAEAFLKTN